MKKLFILMLAVFLIPLVLAQTSVDETYAKNTEVDLKYFCQQENGVDCDTSTQCNITIKYPNSSILVSNKGMTNQGEFHNYTLNTNQTSTSGVHGVKVVCEDGLLTGYGEFTYEINPTGIIATDDRTSAINRSILVFFGLSIMLFATAYFVRLTPLKYSLTIIGAVFVLIGINVTFVSLQDSVVNPNIERLFDVVTAISFYLYWFAGGMIFFIWFITVINTATLRQQRRLEGIG